MFSSILYWNVHCIVFSVHCVIKMSPNGQGRYSVTPLHAYIVCTGLFAQTSIYNQLLLWHYFRATFKRFSCIWLHLVGHRSVCLLFIRCKCCLPFEICRTAKINRIEHLSSILLCGSNRFQCAYCFQGNRAT